MTSMDSALVSARLQQLQTLADRADVDAILISPGPDLRYLIGYDAVPLERLTCLVVPRQGDAKLVVPRLEELAALASPAGDAGVDVLTWGETDDAYSLVMSLVHDASNVAVDNRMWAEKVLHLRSAAPHVAQVLAGPLMDTMRVRKEVHEIEALTRAAAAIDRVHAQVPGLLQTGRSEREIGDSIAELILAEGHIRVDFVIVASGPNGASPHHEVSDRILVEGDPVVVDIGGTMPDGYRSDCTRTYAVGDPGEEYRAFYAHLQRSQEAAVAAVKPGVTCSSIDATARSALTDAGMGRLFIHRTGHGIGLETHEAPYIVEGNFLPLEPGMAFSVEPGFYVEGRFGARIEDIVVVGVDGPIVLNHGTRDLVVVK